MIKILKEGRIKKPTKTIFTAECNHCGCEFEFETEDVLTMERCPDGIMQIQCPYCKVITTLSRSKVRTREEEIEE